jgi:hypothetical protein
MQKTRRALAAQPGLGNHLAWRWMMFQNLPKLNQRRKDR